MILEALTKPKRKPQDMNCIDLADGSVTLVTDQIWETYPQGGPLYHYRVLPIPIHKALNSLKGKEKKDVGNLLQDLIAFAETSGPFEDSPVKEMLQQWEAPDIRQSIQEALETLKDGTATYCFRGRPLTEMPVFLAHYEAESKRLQDGKREKARATKPTEGYCIRCHKWGPFSSYSLPRLYGAVPGAGTDASHKDALSWGVSSADASHLCAHCMEEVSEALQQLPTVPLTYTQNKGGEKTKTIYVSVFGLDPSLDPLLDNDLLGNLFGHKEAIVREAYQALWDIHRREPQFPGGIPPTIGIAVWYRHKSALHILDYQIMSETGFVECWRDFMTKFGGVPLSHLIGASHLRTRGEKKDAPAAVIRQWVARLLRGTPITPIEAHNVLASLKTCALRDEQRPYWAAQEAIMSNCVTFDETHPAALLGALFSETCYLVWAHAKKAGGDPSSRECHYRRRMLNLCLQNPKRAADQMFVKKENISTSLPGRRMGRITFERFEKIKIKMTTDLPETRLDYNDQFLFFKGDAVQTETRQEAIKNKPNGDGKTNGQNNKPGDSQGQ